MGTWSKLVNKYMVVIKKEHLHTKYANTFDCFNGSSGYHSCLFTHTRANICRCLDDMTDMISLDSFYDRIGCYLSFSASCNHYSKLLFKWHECLDHQGAFCSPKVSPS